MRKLITLLTVICITAGLFALEEVRGIQTRRVKNENGKVNGFEVTNENNYAVWLELELWLPAMQCDGTTVPSSMIDSKNITLGPKESYTWTGVLRFAKCGSIIVVNEENNFIKYKAYKKQ